MKACCVNKKDSTFSLYFFEFLSLTTMLLVNVIHCSNVFEYQILQQLWFHRLTVTSGLLLFTCRFLHPNFLLKKWVLQFSIFHLIEPQDKNPPFWFFPVCRSYTIFCEIWFQLNTKSEKFQWHLQKFREIVSRLEQEVVTWFHYGKHSFDRSDNSGDTDVKIDESVLEEESSFKMLGSFSSNLD